MVRNASTIRKQSGFTLLELTIAVALTVVVMGAVFAQVDTAQQRYRAEQQKIDLFQESREFVDYLTRDLRNVGYPNQRNFDQGVLGTDTTNARGLLLASPGDVWFEGDVDGNGTVSVVKYHLDTTSVGCPCLRRSKVNKSASGVDNYSVQVENVQNGTLNNPIFQFFLKDGTAVNLSGYTNNTIDGTTGTASAADLQTLASIKTIMIQLSVQAKYADQKTQQRPIMTLNSTVMLSNCSQMATAQNYVQQGQMSCI